jgi:crotonobetainyl-CoA:carnitine CoA-transferase CaiB-like acyl-CoA transferase
VSELQAARIPAHVSWSAEDIVEDRHLRERGSIVDVTEQSGGSRAVIGCPIRFSKSSDVGFHRGTPELGQDEDYVFGQLLGLSDEERARMTVDKIIF